MGVPWEKRKKVLGPVATRRNLPLMQNFRQTMGTEIFTAYPQFEAHPPCTQGLGAGRGSPTKVVTAFASC